MTPTKLTPMAHRDSMDELVRFMRDRGLISYRGPLVGEGWKVQEVQLSLSTDWTPPPPPQPEKPALPPPEPPKRSEADGLTKDEQRLLYGHAVEE